VDHADLLQRTELYDGVWEPVESRFFQQNLRPDDVLYDIGANIGYFTCLALRAGVRHVVAFEPDPLTSQVLSLNLQLNAFDPCSDRDEVDIEGWEEPMLRGASETLGKLKPRMIVFEAESTAAREMRADGLRHLLESAGYEINWLSSPLAYGKSNYVARQRGAA